LASLGRHGVLAVEVAMLLPVFLTMLFASMEY